LTDKDNKGAIVLGLAGLGVLGWMLLKKKASADKDVVPSGVIDWIGSKGYAGIPVVYENNTSIATVTVTNKSKYSDGSFAPFKFYVGVVLTDSFGNVAAGNTAELPLGPNVTGSVNVPLSITKGYFGPMTAMGYLNDSFMGNELARTAPPPLAVNVVEESPVGDVLLDPIYIGVKTATRYSFVNNMSIALPGFNYLDVYWKNNSLGFILGYMMVSVETPTGTKVFLAAYDGQNTSKGPGALGLVKFDGPVMIYVGTYKYTISLYNLSGSTYILRNRVKRNLIVT